jgi:2',3'-cyclic-nucleotide 2'-phosphodiesterase (5'-nucleotidase family)
MHLTIFHTNDMHGRLEAMARLSAFARQQRAAAEAAGQVVFFWDAGDAADRRYPVFSITKGASIAPLLNAMGYSLQTMGNAIALPYGPQALAAVTARANFPILAANCRDGDDPVPHGLRETATFALPGGRKLGVLGLTAPWNGIYEVFGLRFPDFREVARRLVDVLRRAGAAPIVVLSHLGLDDDRALAEAVGGIDLIIGAHSHDRLPRGEEANGVIIAQAGAYAEALGRVDLEVDPETGRVTARTAMLLDVPGDVAPDPAFQAALREMEREVEARLAEPIGVLQEPLDLDYFAECGLGDLAADALRERMGAEAALVMGGMFHRPLAAGQLTLGALDAACFSSANPGLTVVSGRQIWEALERGLDPEVARLEHGSLRGAPIGQPQVSGLEVVYDPEAETGQRVRQVRVNGQDLRPERLYRLAHTDAETMEAAYLRLEASQHTTYEVPTILREALADYVRRHSPAPAPAGGRWKKSNAPTCLPSG